MNKIMSMCGLESRPRWIDLDSHYMCSCCGETTYEKRPPMICPNCKQEMKKRDFTIKTSNSSGRKTIEIINNIENDDDLIPQWKPKKKKKKKPEKLDPNNLIESEMIERRRKALLDSARALK